MSHITIVINRAATAPTSTPDPQAEVPAGVGYVTVSYTPSDSMTDAEVGQAVKKLYKQVRALSD